MNTTKFIMNTTQDTPSTSADFPLDETSDIQIVPTLSGFCYDNDLAGGDDHAEPEKVLDGFSKLGVEIHEAENFFADGYAPEIKKKPASGE